MKILLKKKRSNNMSKKQPLIINLMAGSGAGKSTCMAKIFSELKAKGIEVEQCPEWVKKMVWEGRKQVFECQDYIFGKQLWEQYRLANKKDNNGDYILDVIITDSPIIFSALYDPENREHFKANVIEKFNSFNNLNFVLNRVVPFDPKGRNEKTISN